MLQNIPTHILAGPLGAGKTSLIQALLSQKPAAERWALLINEFGQIGLDAALLNPQAADIQVAEVAGGCLCCVNGLPFQTALNRLLRQARPDRLLIEPSGLGHPLALMQQLSAPPWQSVLQLQPLVLVLDAAALAAGQPLPAAQQAVLAQAGLLLLNKSEGFDASVRQQLAAAWPNAALFWTTQGRLPVEQLPGYRAQAEQARVMQTEVRPSLGSSPPFLWTDPRQPLCHIQVSDGAWSIGWRWSPQVYFSTERLQQWLAAWPWQRAKLIVQRAQGACSANLLAGLPIRFISSEWRKDSRVELIFSQAQDEALLKAGMQACLSPDEPIRV